MSSILASVGCGPSTGEPETDLPGELLVYEISADDEAASDALSILRPDRTRQRVPIEPLFWETAEATWGLHGDVVLAVDGDLGVWTWSELDEEPTLLRSNGFDDRVSISIAPDSRYARISSYGSTDVPNATDRVYDLLGGALLHSYSSCGDARRFFGWHGDGPSAVGLSSSCQGLGELTGYALIHSTPEQSTQLFEFPPEGVPEIEMSREGGLLYLDYGARWQLYDLADHRIVTERPVEEATRSVMWSPDGRTMYRVDGWILQRVDASGVERWAEDFGLLDSVSLSPAGDRLVVMTGDCGGLGSCIVLVDADDGSREIARAPGASEVHWTPSGDALIVNGWWDSGLELVAAAYWLDVETGQAHVLAPACRSIRWSPNEERVACMAPCSEDDDELYRPLLLDAEGGALAEGSCDRYPGLPYWSPDSNAVALTVTERAEAPDDDRHRAILLDVEGQSHELGPGRVTAGWRPEPGQSR